MTYLSTRLRALTAVFAALLLTLGLATSAQATPIASGTVDWGFHAPVRASFGAGFRVVNAPATQTANDTFALPAATGDVTGGVLTLTTATSGTPGTHLEGGFVKLGYAVGGWPATEPTSGTASGIWTRFGGLQITFDESTGEGELWGIASGGFHFTPVIAPALRHIADLSTDGDTDFDLSAGYVSNVVVTLVDGSLGLGVYPAGTVLDDLNVSFSY